MAEDRLSWLTVYAWCVWGGARNEAENLSLGLGAMYSPEDPTQPLYSKTPGINYVALSIPVDRDDSKLFYMLPIFPVEE